MCGEREDERLRDMLQKRLELYYDLKKGYQVSLLKYSENYTWLIKEGEEKKVLRLCRPGYHTDAELEGELKWLSVLNRDTDIPMAAVIPNRKGKMLTRIEGYTCTMFTFLEGVTLRGIQGKELEQYLYQIGRISAKLHVQVQNWKDAGTLERFTWDYEDLLGENARAGDWRKNPKLTSKEREVFEKAIPVIREKLREYGKSPDRYGLIHSDLNINNVLVKNGRVQILDFDDCGFGWFLYDLSTSVLEYDRDIHRKIHAWTEGYESVRPFTKKDKEMIPTFIVMRKIVRIGWIASHMDNDTVKKVAADYYSQTGRMAEKYYSTGGMEF